MYFLNALYRPMILSLILFIVASGIASFAALSAPSSQAQFSHLLRTALNSFATAPGEALDFILYWGASWFFTYWYFAFPIALLSLGFLSSKPAMRFAGILAILLFGGAMLQIAILNATYGRSIRNLDGIEVISIVAFTLIFTGVYGFAITRFRPRSLLE